MLNKHFPENHAVYEICGISWQATEENMAHANFLLDV
jgi:hypothetical protein